MKRTVLALTIGLCAWHAHAQNTCATAVPVVLATYYISQIDGSGVPAPVCTTGGNNADAGEWYKYTAVVDTSITVTTDLPQNLGIDTRVNIYTGTCGNLVCSAGDDDSGEGYLSVVTFNVVAGQTYYIAFDNNWSSSGFTFKVLKTPPPVPVAGFLPQYIPTDGYAYCVVDMNSDGLDDVVSVEPNAVTINYQAATGGFTTTTHTTSAASNMPSWSLCAGDLDANGYNDLVYAGSGLSFMMANSTGTGYSVVNQPEYIFCQRSNMVDINNDGLLDVFSCHDVAPNVYYLNNGDGTWDWNQGGLGNEAYGGNYGSIWIDHNNDGLVDLFIAKCRGASSPESIDELWENNGDGTYSNVASQMANMADFHQSWSSAWADFDNDGDLDVMIGASSMTGGGHKLLRNDLGSFTNISAGSGFDLYNGTSIEFIARDFDNDGYVDVLGGGSLMRNNGDMTFSPMVVPFYNGPTGDLNNDGFVDVQNDNIVYLNIGNDNNWIKVITQGTESNANGIGARIELTTPTGIQVRDVVSGDGFRYMSTLTAHFGLGTGTEITSVVVRWPSGVVDSIPAPPINGTLTVVEGESGTTTGIAQLPAAQISLFPSPAVNTLHVQVPGGITGRWATITDLAGQVVARPALRQGSIDVSNLSTGLYLLNVETSTGNRTVRFTKQ
ncbi:MAG: VCBS repeat-containing protein [Flavobacteriales bacterium]|nr:VCBS repeat-containing protein [Flavobacteriales bacterium]MBP9079675.1 VCBS repeat-containing protein [Flavobacteriales bacterium]